MVSPLEEQAKRFHSQLASTYKKVCEQSIERAFKTLDRPLSSASRRAIVKVTEAGANDPYGDGDQSILHADRDRHESTALRNAWATGLDFQEAVFSNDGNNSFHLACFSGHISSVRKFVMDAKERVEKGEPLALTHLLEKRISLMRLSPLQYACQGTRAFMNGGVPDPVSMMHFSEVAEFLCANGANVNARDICGFSPLGIVAGYICSPESLKLVPILTKYGADPNVPNRFGESLLVQPIMSSNLKSFRALLMAGADTMMHDTTGLTPHKMAMNSSDLMQIITEVKRAQMVGEKECETCGKKGTSKFCSACKKVFYCSKSCQVRGWRSGHREKCGKDESPEDYVDVEVGTMTTDRMFPHMPVAVFTNRITGATSSTRMKCKEVGVAFVVKVGKPMILKGKEGCLKINVKNSDFLLVDKSGKGKAAFERLSHLCKTKGIASEKIYISAKWISGQAGGSSSGEGKEVLRLDTSTLLPPPKPSW